ncbi:MAG TPA: site-specific DNA-methyltransferase [Bacteroidetes bacterium]|nr:site-specific DNA-methyltransferase [Bacteroidota bacterium]
MNLLPDGSVQLVITSPPYWQLKDYGTKDQIGYHDSYENYINHLNLVWKECHRALQPGCRLCINIGDQFARSVYYGRYKVIPIRTEIIKFCETVGFDYMGAIIWQKVTTTNTTGGATIMGSYPNPRNGILKLDYEFILLFKKHGKAVKPDPELKAKSAMTKEEWNRYFTGHWHFSGAKQDGHIAMFPEELPTRLIKMFAFVGDTVLDPFLGSGTTSLAAKKLNRNSVGYEINSSYFPKIKNKLNTEGGGKNGFQFLKDKLNIDPKKEIIKLPYIFKDPLLLDKKIDPKKRQFGSKLGNEKIKEREEYFSIKKVISPEKVQLNDGREIYLIGIKIKKGMKGKAIGFLKNKTKGQKIYLRFDEKIKSGNKKQHCYLYLKNRTFLNAHLIKNGLVVVDVKLDFKYKKKFLNLQAGF